MNNKELAHLWAHQTQRTGAGSHFFFEGATIYSWGHHFAIARLFAHPVTGAQCVLFTSRDYSNSTARHKYHARNALPGSWPIFYVNDVEGQATDARAVAKLEEAAEKLAAERAESERKAAERAAVKAAKLLARSPEIIAEWLSGQRASLPRELNTVVLLRRAGDDMETSKGARVPIAEAQKAFRFCALARSKGWHRNGQQFAIGHYQLDAVNEFGVIAGCHRVSWSEVDRFAKAEGWAA